MGAWLVDWLPSAVTVASAYQVIKSDYDNLI